MKAEMDAAARQLLAEVLSASSPRAHSGWHTRPALVEESGHRRQHLSRGQRVLIGGAGLSLVTCLQVGACSLKPRKGVAD